jgi:hypothetical protein
VYYVQFDYVVIYNSDPNVDTKPVLGRGMTSSMRIFCCPYMQVV